MKTLWIILILFCINSCSYEQQRSIETIENSDIYINDNLKEDTTENLRKKIDFSISHLNKIIERNENKITEWESELLTADSTVCINLQMDINQMKNRVVIQKERLRRLKSKDD
ncbi:MAG: hypothetical protein CVV25_11150 [Ignavibacteriae bacterium HGW-Ignavibacteriae-4]|nr:MAG: hypothetical protein CVV25_11150 [Ignavibacteriae bacterium HGW-Ignavibacteriae-4]